MCFNLFAFSCLFAGFFLFVRRLFSFVRFLFVRRLFLVCPPAFSCLSASCLFAGFFLFFCWLFLVCPPAFSCLSAGFFLFVRPSLLQSSLSVRDLERIHYVYIRSKVTKNRTNKQIISVKMGLHPLFNRRSPSEWTVCNIFYRSIKLSTRRMSADDAPIITLNSPASAIHSPRMSS